MQTAVSMPAAPLLLATPPFECLRPPFSHPPSRVFAPTFFTSRGVIAFNFTGFVEPHSGPLSFTWGVGSAPGLVDVLPAVRYNGERWLAVRR